MKKHLPVLLTALLGGEAMLILRTVQNTRGLAPGALPGRLTVVVLAALCAALVYFVRRLPAENPEGMNLPLGGFFHSRSDAAPTLLLMGIFLWLISGLLEILSFPVSLHFTAEFSLFLTESSLPAPLKILSGAATVISALSLTPLVFLCRPGGRRLQAPRVSQEDEAVLLLIPVGAMVVRLVLLYREKCVDPALSTYYVEILGLVMLTLSLQCLSAFAFRCGSTRRFLFCAGLAEALLTATLADEHPPIYVLLYLGGALLMLGLTLMRLEALSAPAEPGSGSRK